MTTQIEHDVDTLNSLLRGELSAIESYEYALSRFEGELHEAAIRRICLEHRDAAMMLRQLVVERGGEPWVHSGPWGYFAAAITGTAKLIGEVMTLSALLRGERYGAHSYEDAIANDLLSPECLELIADQLLPVTQMHVERLAQIIDSLA